MKKSIKDIIRIDSSLAVPVYKQIVQSVHKSIEKGILSQNDMLPSVNSIAETFSLARGSVFTAYNDLRASGIIDSVPGKGYFVASTRVKQKKKIFLLFCNLSHREASIYNAILNNLPEDCIVDIYFHRDDPRLFESLVTEQADRYNTFIIVPQVHEKTPSILSKLEEKQVFLLDTGYKEYRKTYDGVFLNPDKCLNDIFAHFRDSTGRYKRLSFVPAASGDVKDFTAAFNKHVKKVSPTPAVVADGNFGNIKKGDAFIVMEDKDLVRITETAKAKGYVAGKDIGIISWNDSVLKTVILDGITTVEADFEKMANDILEMVFSGKKQVLETEIKITDRKSF